MKYIITDIDGTIADCTHRMHHRMKTPPDWESFFAECDEDEPYSKVINIIEKLTAYNDAWHDMYEAIYVTGRPERIRSKTVRWLDSFVLDLGYTLLMRPDGDHRPAEVVKLEQVAKAGIKPEDILCVFDDDEDVCQAWKELGVTVYKVL